MRIFYFIFKKTYKTYPAGAARAGSSAPANGFQARLTMPTTTPVGRSCVVVAVDVDDASFSMTSRAIAASVVALVAASASSLSLSLSLSNGGSIAAVDDDDVVNVASTD